MDFAVPTNYRIKLKLSKKIGKYLDLARELEEQWNVKVSAMLIVIGIFGTIAKG